MRNYSLKISMGKIIFFVTFLFLIISSIVLPKAALAISDIAPEDMQLMVDVAKKQAKENTIQDPAQILLASAGAFIFYIVTAYIFAILAVLLAARYAILAALYILSPIAFAFWIFPSSRFKKYHTEWWEAFFKWCFVGIFIAFFIYLATKILEAKTVNNNLDGNTLLVCFVFLYVGYKMARDASPKVASAVIGIAGAAAGYAMGAAKLGAGGAAKVLDQKILGGRGAAAGQKIKSWGGRLAEKVGMRAIGTTAAANTKEVESQAGLMAKEYAAAKATGDTATISRIQKLARSERGARGAAAYKVVSEAKDLHKAFADSSLPGGVNLAKAADRGKYAEAAGATGIIKSSEKAMPKLAGYNKITTGQIEKEINPATGRNFTTAEASREAERRRIAGMSIPEMRDIPAKQIDADHIEDSNYKTYERASLEYSTEQKESAKKAISDLRDRRDAVVGLGPLGTGATTAQRTAQRAARNAALARLTGAAKKAATEKIRDFNRKIKITKDL